jgi:hypothetical protein
MSSFAIKSFFNHQREVTARRNEYYKRMLEEMNTVHEELVDTTAFDKEVDYFDFLLKRNWFLDEDSIVELLLDADEDVFQEIVRRIGSYPANIRHMIAGFIPISTGNVTLTLREISNDTMDIRDYKEHERHRKIASDAWAAYMVANNLQPPIGSLDAELGDMFTYLQTLKKDLEIAKKKSLTGRYVAPAMRDAIIMEDPKVIEVRKKIEKSENEIIYQNQCIEQEKNAWFLRKRREFEQEMFAM